MKRIFFFIIIVIATSYAFATDEVSDYIKKQNLQIRENNKKQQQGIKNQEQEFQKYTYHSSAEFETWYALRKKAIAEFKKEILGLWGEYQEPSNKVWIEYNRDKRSVSSVDFEKGVATVSILVAKDASRELIKERLIKAVTRVITSKGSTGAEPEEQDDPAKQMARPMLQNQVIDKTGNPVTVTSVSRFAQGLVEQATAIPADSVVKVQICFNLAPDHLEKRAEQFMPIIKKLCAKYNLDISRVLATIHTESQFNPLAQSSVNAIGLMQLVPIYGGREAYLYVYGVDAIPREESLFDPELNIELGCAYIYLLKNRHFSLVPDQEKNCFCTIAAYNTGPKNVATAFTGQRDVEQAAKIINAMENAQKVYDHLMRNLPYQETRQYLADVVEKMKLYK